jgi:thiamine monophosphate synthase
VPVLAIGGLTVDRVGPVAAAGAAGIAAISLFLQPVGSLGRTVDEIRRRFDSARADF